MNEEIEYAEMLEIPVSTVNVVQKRSRKKSKKNERLEESLIDKINEKIGRGEAEEKAEEETVYSDGERAYISPVREIERAKENKAHKIVLGAEFAMACVLCGGIFLTNVFMPTSAINTFFRSFSAQKETNARSYSDFTLSGIAGDYSDAEVSVSSAGVLSFTAKGHVYPAADGEVSSVVQNADGSYDLRVAYAEDFYGVVSGLDVVYYEAGATVKANIPVGYSNGENAVRMTLYAGGELLTCFTVDEAGNLIWTEKNA